MRIEKLNLEHKGLLYEKLKKIDLPLSEYSFTNLYLFRDAWQEEKDVPQNQAQDLGRQALKIAKSSYLPDNKLKKFRVKIKNGGIR